MIENNANLGIDKVVKSRRVALVKKGQMLTVQELIAEMKRMQGDRQDQEYARELGISPSYLSGLYRGKSDPGELVLQAIGWRKRVFYEKIENVA